MIAKSAATGAGGGVLIDAVAAGFCRARVNERIVVVAVVAAAGRILVPITVGVGTGRRIAVEISAGAVLVDTVTADLIASGIGDAPEV